MSGHAIGQALKERTLLEGPNTNGRALLLVLLRIRSDIVQERIEKHLGETNIHRLVGFVDGYRACLVDGGADDAEFERFCEWLRSVKEEFPVEGWAAKYLRDCNGDHLAAIKKFLDFVTEFVEAERRSSGQDGVKAP